MQPATINVKSIFFVLLLAICILHGCTPKPLLIDVEQIEPKIVVASQIIPGQAMFIGLTRSFGALEMNADSDSVSNEFLDKLLLDHALVTVSYMDQTDTLYKLEKGIYVSVLTPQYHHEEYRLYVYDSTDGSEVFAMTTMLPQVGFDSVYPYIEKNGDDTIVYLHYSFTDPPEENWYMVNYYKNQDNDTAAGFDLNNYFNRGDNVLIHTDVLSDKTFESQYYEATIALYGAAATDSIAVTMSNISEDYYKFLDLRNKSQNWFAEVTNEPINYPTNVIGGLGFFNTHFPDVRFFDLNNFEIEY